MKIPVSLLAAAVLFAFAHTQSPLYYSNQNQYLLHGAAQAGFGQLAHDWLAGTADPTPAFSAFTALCFRTSAEWAFQAVYFAVILVAFLAMGGIAARLPFAPQTSRGRWLLYAGLIAIYSAILRYGSDRLLGADYPWFFQCGLASQYILGPGYQPSVVGVLLLLAITAYVHERTILACVLAAAANLIHSTYLLPSALLIVGFLTAEITQRQWRTVILAAILSLLTVTPTLLYNTMTFATGDWEDLRLSQQILADVRIPHHARAERWFDWIAGCQLVWMALAQICLWKTRLFLPVAVTSTMALLLSVIAIVTGDATLSLLFPWRISAVLVPLATLVLFAHLARRLESMPYLGGIAGVVIAACLAGAVAVYALRLGYREPAGEDPALEFVRLHHQPGEMYLVPARFPLPTTARGVFSNTFAKPPNPTAIVYFEMARFRLKTGAPLYIDFKSIPYRASEVLEWHRRVAQVEGWFQEHDWDRGIADQLRAEKITHVVLPVSKKIQCSRFHLLFEGGTYHVYSLS